MQARIFRRNPVKSEVQTSGRLKAAGLALFGEKGYENTSIDGIARRAKLAAGGFYQHFRSKRQLLLALMDELLEKLSQLDLRLGDMTDVRAAIQQLLSRAFSSDLRYLGAYRAWQEAALSDPDLARKQEQIQAWTTTRVVTLFSTSPATPRREAGGGYSRIGTCDGQFLLEPAGASRTLLQGRIESVGRFRDASHLPRAIRRSSKEKQVA